MNLISCTNDCIYQEDGECRLEMAASCGIPGDCSCAYYIQKIPVSPVKNIIKNPPPDDPDGGL